MDLKEKGFQLPENINFDSESLTDSYGKLYAEAFERGFGTTVGNALRRVLLSSIEGAAVTSVRIPGVLHEFSSVPGVKEDIVDVILNVKQLRFKIHSDSAQVVSLKAKGPGEITGKDIESISQVEVLNPDQYIATLDKSGKINAELTVEKGKGYVPAEQNQEKTESVDSISVDSIFTPVRKVNFWVEGARVGRSTDYDKLVMEIWTDGSISPQQALSEASNILREHLSIFSLDPVETQKEAVVQSPEGSEDEDESMSDFFEEYPDEVNDCLMKNVDELELSVRSYNCLKNANIRTLADLVQRTEQEMLRTKNFGRKSLNEIKEIIETMGLHFNMRVDVDELEKIAAKKRPENAT